MSQLQQRSLTATGHDLDERVAIFDFGGGTFDVSILQIRGEIFEVLATDGDFFLGGDDLDRALAEYLAAELTRTTWCRSEAASHRDDTPRDGGRRDQALPLIGRGRGR